MLSAYEGSSVTDVLLYFIYLDFAEVKSINEFKSEMLDFRRV